VTELGALSVQVAIRVPDYVVNDSVQVVFGDTLGNPIYTDGGHQILGYPVDSVTDKAELLSPAASGLKWMGFEANPVISVADTTSDTITYRVFFRLYGLNEHLLDSAGVFALFGSQAGTLEFKVTEWKPVVIPTLTEWGLIIFAVLLSAWMAWMFLRRRRRVTVSTP
jgi:hypothetical protein